MELNDRQKQLKKQGTLKLKGKDYLQVAARIAMFREDHPDYGILTEVVTITEVVHVKATVFDGGGNPLASAHKRVREGGRGPAADFPVETAETGAIGRALGLIGYGTLAGDFTEGEDIADAPIDKNKW